MSKYTPGPWMARFEKVRYVIFVDGEIGEKALATTGGAYPDSEANALLIASAPDLLEALRAVQGHLLNAVIGLETGCTKKTAIATLDGGIAIARAAIAKALGEQA